MGFEQTERAGKQHSKRKRPKRNISWVIAIFVSLFTLHSFYYFYTWRRLKLHHATSMSSEEHVDETLRLATIERHAGAPSAKYSATTVTSNKVSVNGQLLSSCQCELLSTDCLHSIACIPDDEDGRSIQRSIARGVQTRSAIRNITQFQQNPFIFRDYPIGKTVQYSAIRSWLAWTNGEEGLPDRHGPSMFVDASRYSTHCSPNDGFNCFFESRSSRDYHDAIELSALSNFPPSEEMAAATEAELTSYRNQSRVAGQALPAWDHLRVFSHLCRIQFNIRQPIVESYQKHLVTTSPSGGTLAGHPANDGDGNGNAYPLRVSLHIRRADSCEHEREGSGGRYLNYSSHIKSHAQVSGQRRCYATAVYMRALNDVRTRSGRALEIYLSTDYAGTLVKEIQNNYPTLYRSCTWKYLDFPRDTFVYQYAIETPSNKEKHAILGESAVADLWHLSHGQVFVGHVGSRFGKVAWLLATAKYDSFVPFHTVDGRSYCCEIDEVCGDASPYIKSMEQCLVFAHDMFAGRETPEDTTSYWTVGSTVRRRYAELQLKRREELRNQLTRLEELRNQLARLDSWLGTEAEQ